MKCSPLRGKTQEDRTVYRSVLFLFMLRKKMRTFFKSFRLIKRKSVYKLIMEVKT